MKGSSRTLSSRAGWNLVDQALSSVSNFALFVVVARVTTADGFGQFALAFTLYSFLLGVSRAICSTPFVIRSSAVHDSVALSDGRQAAGLAAVFGVASAALLIPCAALVGQQYAPSVIAMAFALPGLFVQDAWRALLVARGRPRAAAANDSLWLAGEIATLGAAIVLGWTSPADLIIAWAAAGCGAAAVGVLQWGGWPWWSRGWAYLRRHLDISWHLALGWVANVGSTQVAVILVAALGTALDVGALRGAQTMIGPVTLLGVAIFNFVLPEVVRRPKLVRSRLMVIAALTSGTISVAALAWCAVLLLLPDAWGRAILGDTWPGASAVLVPMTLFTVGIALSHGPIVILRAKEDTRATLVLNVLLGLLLLTLIVVGVTMGGATGAAWGYAAAAALTAPLWWWRAHLVASRPTPPPR